MTNPKNRILGKIGGPGEVREEVLEPVMKLVRKHAIELDRLVVLQVNEMAKADLSRATISNTIVNSMMNLAGRHTITALKMLGYTAEEARETAVEAFTRVTAEIANEVESEDGSPQE